ncbi:MAG TPA: LacI family DNA-binding transcriptional regulator [Capsulimonadaceae bacterium]|jgi:DNA-binding LacI/PurR family transcriptional regulator
MSVTIKDIAQSLNISEATVSRSLRNDPVINPATRARVHHAAISIGYQGPSRRPRMRRDQAAGAAKPAPTTVRPVDNGIAVLLGVPDASHARTHGNVVRLLQGITAECDAVGFRQSLHIIAPIGSEPDTATAARMKSILEGGGLAGLIVEGLVPDIAIKLASEQFPVVTIARRYDDLPADALVSDNMFAFCHLVETLADLGHERFVFVDDDRLDTFVDERYAGFVIGCGRKGISLANQRRLGPASYIAFGPEVHIASEAMDELLAPPHPTAYVCVNDRAAWRLLAACRQRGLEAPRDISVAGFDNDAITFDDGVRKDRVLTTIDPSYVETGRYAVRLLNQRIAQPSTPYLRVSIPYRFIEGETIGPAPTH